jgi:hypothetical protein
MPNLENKKPYKSIVSARLNALIDDFDGPPRSDLSKVTDRQLVESCLAAQSELFRRAKAGGDEATDYFLRLAIRGTGLLDQLARCPSELLLSFAHDNAFWPAFYSPKPGFVAESNETLKKLGIGQNSQLNVNPKSKWAWHVEARKWAFRVIHMVRTLKADIEGAINDHPDVRIVWTPITKAAYELPPLTKATAGLWMERVGWQLILDMTKNAPEKDLRLRKLGTHRARHTPTAKPGSKTEASNIRDGIRKAVTQALSGMASEPAPSP